MDQSSQGDHHAPDQRNHSGKDQHCEEQWETVLVWITISCGWAAAVPSSQSHYLLPQFSFSNNNNLLPGQLLQGPHQAHRGRGEAVAGDLHQQRETVPLLEPLWPHQARSLASGEGEAHLRRLRHGGVRGAGRAGLHLVGVGPVLPVCKTQHQLTSPHQASNQQSVTFCDAKQERNSSLGWHSNLLALYYWHNQLTTFLDRF